MTANVLALESRDGDKSLDSAVIVSVDTAVVRASFLLPIRAEVQRQLPGCDLGKLIVAATHTHSAPPTRDGHFKQQEGVQVPSDYVRFAAARIGAAASRRGMDAGRPGSLTGWAMPLSPTTAGPSTPMARPSCTGRRTPPISAPWKGWRIMTSTRCSSGTPATNCWRSSSTFPARRKRWKTIACSPPTTGARPVKGSRKNTARTSRLWGCGAAGDQSPHFRYRQAADDRMRSLRKLDRLREIARRIVHGVDDAYEVVQTAKQDDVVVKHQQAVLHLPHAS